MRADSLYSALSVLRKAMGQVRGGPQFVISQGEGVAVNNEFVVSDIYQFEMLARTVLLKRAGVTAPQLIDACLKIEQVYQGPLYVPDRGNPAFFLRMRSVLQTKFVDCMLRGVEDGARQEETSLRVLDDGGGARTGSRARGRGARGDARLRLGRQAHRCRGALPQARALSGAAAKGVPEPETRELYERIINQAARLRRRAGMTPSDEGDLLDALAMGLAVQGELAPDDLDHLGVAALASSSAASRAVSAEVSRTEHLMSSCASRHSLACSTVPSLTSPLPMMMTGLR